MRHFTSKFLCVATTFVCGLQSANAQNVMVGEDGLVTITTTAEGQIGQFGDYGNVSYTSAVKEQIGTNRTTFKVSGPINNADVNAILYNNGEKGLTHLDLQDATIEQIVPLGGTETGTFAQCQNGYATLTYLAFPKISSTTNTTLPGKAFNQYGNYQTVGKLKTIIIPEGYTEIGEGLFLQESDLTDLQLPNSLKKIDAKAFWQCTSLTSLTLPQSLEYVGDEAFYQHKVKVLLFPENVHYLGASSFQSSSNDMSDVYFQSRTAPECAVDVFGSGAYNGWGGNSGGNLANLGSATRSNYVNNGFLFCMLHFRPDLTDEERATYWDATRSYTIPDTYLGKQRMWPTQEEYTKGTDNIYDYKSSTHDKDGITFDGTALTDEQKKHIGILRFILARADAPIPDQALNVTLDGNWWTICLPYDLSAEEMKTVFGSSVQLYTLDNVRRCYTNSEVLLNFTSNQLENADADKLFLAGGGIKAWYPYLIKPQSVAVSDVESMQNKYATYKAVDGEVQVTLAPRVPQPGSEQDVTCEALTGDGCAFTDATDNGARWNYTYRGNCSGDNASTTTGAEGQTPVVDCDNTFTRPSVCYFLGGKKVDGKLQISFYYQNGKTATWKPYTCVVIPSKTTTSGETKEIDYCDDSFKIQGGQKAKNYQSVFGFEETTGISHMQIVTPDRAACGNVYSITGQLVKANNVTTDGLAPGVYVVGGKKVVVK